jgi:hypothetical protein
VGAIFPSHPEWFDNPTAELAKLSYKEEEAIALLPLLFCDNFEGHWGICREIRGVSQQVGEKREGIVAQFGNRA